MRLIPSKSSVLALSWAAFSLPALAQVQVLQGQGSSEVHKCVRAGEIFYTNGACPSGTAEVKLGEAGRGAAPRVRSAPTTPVTAPAPPVTIAPAEPVQRRAAPLEPPRRSAPTQPIQSAPAMQSTTPIEPWTTVQPGSLQRRPAAPTASTSPTSRAEADPGVRPLSAFPPLPESDAGRRAGRAERSDRGERSELSERSGSVVQIEEPMRGGGRSVEAMPAPDAKASNQAMCGFVDAEMARLAQEASAANGEGVRASIAAQQQRLKARQAQLKC